MIKTGSELKWKDIPEYEGYYQISNTGIVKSLERPVNNPVNQTTPEQILKPSLKRGYKTVVLHKNNIRKYPSVHRLVALTFIPNPQNKPQVNHINGVKKDNRIENLEWATSKENIRHAWDNGLSKARVGNQHHYSKLKKEQIPKIRELIRTMSTKKIGEMFGVSKGCIDCIKHNITWKHVK